MHNVDSIVAELQMVTGVVTEDLDYLMFILLDGGSYFKEDNLRESKYVISDVKVIESHDIDVDSWFNEIDEIVL